MRLAKRSPSLPRRRGLTPNPQLQWLKGLRGIDPALVQRRFWWQFLPPPRLARNATIRACVFGRSQRRDFDIHFHQGEDAIAKRLAAVAEQVATEMEPRLGRPRMRVNVILVDQTDLSNGWATPVPYNLIEIAAAGPRADSIIGNTRDWLRLVFTHEYTSRPPSRALARLVRRHWTSLWSRGILLSQSLPASDAHRRDRDARGRSSDKAKDVRPPATSA